MTTTLDYRRIVPANRQRDDITAHLGILSMWALVGLALTGLAFALGFGSDVALALAAAG